MQTCPHCHRGIDIEVKVAKPQAPPEADRAYVTPGLMRQVRLIQMHVANHFGLTLTDILIERKSTCLVVPRQVAAYIARHNTKASRHELAECFKRDQGTIGNSLRRVKKRMAADPEFAAIVAKLSEAFQPLEDLDVEEPALEHAPANPRAIEQEPTSCTRLAVVRETEPALAAAGAE